MAEFDESTCFVAANPKHSFVVPTTKVVLLPGSGHPSVIECLPGKWNVFVPHVPWDQLDERLQYNSLGFLLVHDSWRDSWNTEGAFGHGALPIQRSKGTFRCSNSILAFADDSVTLAREFVQEKDRKAARLLEVEILRQMAFDCVEAVARDRWSRSRWENDGYLDSSLRVCAFPINMGQGGSVCIQFFKMGDLVVRIQAKYDEVRARPAACVVAAPIISPQSAAWRERVGSGVYEDEFATFAQVMDQANREANREAARARSRKRAKERFSKLAIDTLADASAELEAGKAKEKVYSANMQCLQFWQSLASPAVAVAAAESEREATIYDEFEEFISKAGGAGPGLQECAARARGPSSP